MNVFRTERIALLFAVLTAIFAAACSSAPDQAANGSVKVDDTLEAAYTRLFDAVKKKDTEAISKEMSQETLKFAAGASARLNKTIEETLANGFTATTFANAVPQMRDPRIKNGFGSLEVWNVQEQVWEDLPFVAENGKWKLAIGDLYGNKFKSPGDGQSMRDRMAANAAGVGNTPPQKKADNTAGNVNTVQVEPLPANKR